MKNIFNEESKLTLKKVAKLLKIESYVSGDDMGNVFNEFPIYNESFSNVKIYGVLNGSNVLIDDSSFFCYKGKLTKNLIKLLSSVSKSLI